MSPPTDPTARTYRSPFVARLVANVLLDALMQSMQVAGIVLSPRTWIALRALRGQIDVHVRRVARAGPQAGAQPLLDELHGLIEQLQGLQIGPPPDPDLPTLPSDDPAR